MEAIEKNPLLIVLLGAGAWYVYNMSKPKAGTATLKTNPQNSGLGAIFPSRPSTNAAAVQNDPWAGLLGIFGSVVGKKVAQQINTPSAPDAVLTGSPPMYNSDAYNATNYGANQGAGDDVPASPFAAPVTNPAQPSDLMNFYG